MCDYMCGGRTTSPFKIGPFCTMGNSEEDRYSNSYGFFMHGEEILSGAQWILEPKMLGSCVLPFSLLKRTVSDFSAVKGVRVKATKVDH